eukprot:TRINITY_DN1979_c0_g1_i1.p1 TRINITY_DN1979_c0_g1~~TRINITY_DN1979_c0_g1_i1.p1  ORF type:complete len:121 (-),score=33.77 TRINITY_DN1979_c0_g1_i1:37-399(-)
MEAKTRFFRDSIRNDYGRLHLSDSIKELERINGQLEREEWFDEIELMTTLTDIDFALKCVWAGDIDKLKDIVISQRNIPIRYSAEIEYEEDDFGDADDDYYDDYYNEDNYDYYDSYESYY